MKLTRGAYMTYLDTTFGGDTPSWYLVGKDIEEMSVDLSPDVETVKNILDETSVKDNGYEPSTEADPFYADPEDELYPMLRDIAMGRLKGDTCKTKILEVIVEDTDDAAHLAYIEDVIVKPTSIGGDTSGVSIPFTVHYAGNRTKGTVVIADKKPTFTAGEATAASENEAEE